MNSKFTFNMQNIKLPLSPLPIKYTILATICYPQLFDECLEFRYETPPPDIVRDLTLIVLGSVVILRLALFGPARVTST